MAKLVSKVYGDALFETAMEKGVLSDWYEEVQALRGIFAEHADLAQFLNHPQITKEEKVSVAENIFRGRISEGLLGFLVIVIEKGRQNDILPICDYFIDRVKEYKKIGVAYITTPLAMNEIQKANLKERLLATTPYEEMEIHYEVEEDLIGGMVIRIGDRVVDSSIRTKLEELKRQLLKVQI